MIEVCYNCQGHHKVWNGFRWIACPICGNRGLVDRIEQADLFNRTPDVHITRIRPDAKLKRSVKR